MGQLLWRSALSSIVVDQFGQDVLRPTHSLVQRNALVDFFVTQIEAGVEGAQHGSVTDRHWDGEYGGADRHNGLCYAVRYFARKIQH